MVPSPKYLCSLNFKLEVLLCNQFFPRSEPHTGFSSFGFSGLPFVMSVLGRRRQSCKLSECETVVNHAVNLKLPEKSTLSKNMQFLDALIFLICMAWTSAHHKPCHHRMYVDHAPLSHCLSNPGPFAVGLLRDCAISTGQLFSMVVSSICIIKGSNSLSPLVQGSSFCPSSPTSN